MYNTSKLKYSARVNYDVACPMHFEEYPMDTQRCNISFESWGHPCQVNIDYIEVLVIFVNDLKHIFIYIIIYLVIYPFQYIVLTWLREKRKFSSSISLAQFDLDVNFIEEPLSNFSILGKNSFQFNIFFEFQCAKITYKILTIYT